MYAPFGLLIGVLINLLFFSGKPVIQGWTPCFYGLFWGVPLLISALLDHEDFDIADASIFGILALAGFIVAGTF